MKRLIPTLCKTILFGSWIKGKLEEFESDKVLIREQELHRLQGEYHVSWFLNAEAQIVQVNKFYPLRKGLISVPVAVLKVKTFHDKHCILADAVMAADYGRK